MKIRNGFVSNSSSSSFCIIGNRVYLNDIVKNEYEDLYCIGNRELCEGYDVFRVTKQMLKLIKKNKDKFINADFYANSIFIQEDGKRQIQIDNTGKYDVAVGLQSHHSSYDIEVFKREYIDTVGEFDYES